MPLHNIANNACPTSWLIHIARNDPIGFFNLAIVWDLIGFLLWTFLESVPSTRHPGLLKRRFCWWITISIWSTEFYLGKLCDQQPTTRRKHASFEKCSAQKETMHAQSQNLFRALSTDFFLVAQPVGIRGSICHLLNTILDFWQVRWKPKL